MSRSLRRCVILLPLRFNDGQSVPDDIVAETLLELEQQFGAVLTEMRTIRGLRRHEDESYRNDLVRVSWTSPMSPRSPVLRRVQGAIEGPVPADRYLDNNVPDRGLVIGG